MQPLSPSAQPRIDLVDVLRALALLGIVTIHAMAHFSCGNYPPPDGGLMDTLNRETLFWTCLFFESKAYMLFSFLFGLSFFLQMDRAGQRGEDFRLRFLWRMALLFCFGLVNTFFFDGDILMIFAVAGVLLVPLHRMGTAALFCLALLFLINPLGLYNLWAEVRLPGSSLSWFQGWEIGPRHDDTLLNMATWNFQDGLMRRIIMQITYGRLSETLGLLMLGVCAGRMRLFEQAACHKPLMVRLACLFAPLAVVLGVLHYRLPGLLPAHWRHEAAVLTSAYWSLCFVTAFVALFCLLFHNHRRLAETASRWLAPAGRMSLTCYVSQSVLFTFLFAGWGLGMAPYMGLLYSTLSGIALFGIQALACKYWLALFRYGPLEWLWRSGTRMQWQPLRRQKHRTANAAPQG